MQVASGRFGVARATISNAGAAIEIKMGQGAKPGIGGHLPGAKIVGDVSKTRMIPEGSDAISPAPHHDIYSIEDLRQLVYSLKEATAYKKPVIVKIAAVHNVAAIASGIARSGADIIAIDGFRGGTGAAPTAHPRQRGHPHRARAGRAWISGCGEEGIRNNVSLVAGGSIRSSAPTSSRPSPSGRTPCYIAHRRAAGARLPPVPELPHGHSATGASLPSSPELVKRLDPDDRRSSGSSTSCTAWKHEIKEMMGGMGINSIEALRGNRVMLRGIGLDGEGTRKSSAWLTLENDLG